MMGAPTKLYKKFSQNTIVSSNKTGAQAGARTVPLESGSRYNISTAIETTVFWLLSYVERRHNVTHEQA